MRAAILATCLAAPLACGQGQHYAFDERKPKTVLEKLVDNALPSLVKVHGASGLSTIDPYAAGIIVSDQGHILTLDLVMVQRDKTRVVLADGSVHQAKLLPPDPALGVRMLKIDPDDVEIELRPLAPSTKLPPNGTFVTSIGNCFRLAEYSEKLSATFGVIVATAKTGLRYMLSDVSYDGRLLITDAPNNPGQFGGALFTLDGQWIGINARVVESTETNTQISAAIPAADLVAYIRRWTSDDPQPVAVDPATEAKPVYHGIRLFDHGGRRSPPAYVERVAPGSPARRLGLKPDDLIVRLDEFTIRSCKEFRETMAKFAPGQTIDVTYKRGTRIERGRMQLEAVK
jgi:S1-C subfamily serine protease